MLLIPAQERNIRLQDTALRHSLILRFLEARFLFLTEVEIRAMAGCFAFRIFRLNPNINISELLLIML